jgi:hypothetical protein
VVCDVFGAKMTIDEPFLNCSSHFFNLPGYIVRLSGKVTTLSFTPPYTIPSFNGIHKVKKFLLNLNLKG